MLSPRKYYPILEELYSFKDFAKIRNVRYNQKNYQVNGLKQLLKVFDNPHLSLKTFHIAGTKGKGSTAFYLANCLKQRGFKVGLYTSPHVIDERDRFCINNKKIKWDEFIEHLTPLLMTIRTQKTKVTVFDIFTATAFLYFKKNEVDYAVIETGLGGRLDSTNIIKPMGVIITKIGLEHTDVLGKTLSSIAQEKAGIIKKTIPTFTPQKQSIPAMRVIKEVAKNQKSPLIEITPRQVVSLSFNLELPNFQKENIALAFTCFNHFFLPLSLKERKQIGHKKIEGRFDLQENCLFDGAHTPIAFKELVKAVRQLLKVINFKRIKLVFYCLPDKDFAKIIKTIPKDWEIIFFPLSLPFLGLDINEHPLLKKKKQYLRIKFLSPSDQFQINADDKTLHIISGSFYLIQYFWRNKRKLIKK